MWCEACGQESAFEERVDTVGVLRARALSAASGLLPSFLRKIFYYLLQEETLTRSTATYLHGSADPLAEFALLSR